MLFYMCHTIKVLISNSPRKLKFSQCLQAGNFDFSHQGHALISLYVQFLCSDWSRFDRWVNAENLCSMHLGLCQLVMFLTVFFHWVCKVKFSCYQESSVTHGWFVYWVFGFSLVKVGNPISEWHRFRNFHLAWCVRGLKSLKQFWPYSIVFSASRMVNLSNY